MRATLLPALLLAACQVEYSSTALRDEIVVPPNAPDLGPTLVEDLLNQGSPKKIDILWVIDNSSSMLAEQQKLRENFPSFVQYYRNSGLDWQIGVISTDLPNDGGVLRAGAGYPYIDRRVPDPTGVFQQMAALGRDGAPREQGHLAIHTALTEPVVSRENAGFYRDDALLSIIIVSDENDFSNGYTPDELQDWLLTLKPDPAMVTFSGIIGDEECGQSDGWKHRQIIEATGGAEFSICTEDWTPILANLGVRTAGLTREFYLSQAPVVDTLDVWIEDLGEVFEFERGVDYTYDDVANSITFLRYTPRSSATVHVTYEKLSDL